jgi:hypothetical protein
VYAGPSDAEGFELGDNRTIPYVEGPASDCKVDHVLKDGDIIEAAGFTLQAILFSRPHKR